jgi:O-glycosyl hydrolase
MLELNQNTCEHFHSVESALYASLNADRNNTIHTALFLDKRNCMVHLSECVASSYVQAVYNDFIYPVYVYLEWANNYLSIGKFCEDHKFTEKQALKLIALGKKILNDKYEIMNKI